jgi:hypothetical protein
METNNILAKFDQIAEDYRRHFKPATVFSQLLLSIKGSICTILQKDNPEKYYIVQSGDKFGISESIVNQLMDHAYNRGLEAGKQRGYDAGYSECRSEVAILLGLSDETD